MNLEQLNAVNDALRQGLERVVVGQEEAVTLLLVALLSEGHLLLEGVPGTAKTLLARTFSRLISMEFKRIQFTPDLLPGDLLGTNLFDFSTSSFTLTKGPIFTQLLLADEINRTPPKTQAALLEAMQERRVTIDGDTYDWGPGLHGRRHAEPARAGGDLPAARGPAGPFPVQGLYRLPHPRPGARAGASPRTCGRHALTR